MKFKNVRVVGHILDLLGGILRHTDSGIEKDLIELKEFTQMADY